MIITIIIIKIIIIVIKFCPSALFCSNAFQHSATFAIITGEHYQLTTCIKSTLKTLEKAMKYVQS